MNWREDWDLTTIPDSEFKAERGRRHRIYRKPTVPADTSPKRLEFLKRRKEYLRKYRAKKRKSG